MPEVLVFGATGYTGRLVSRALSARGADFIVAGRDRVQLEDIATASGASDLAIAEVGDAPGLAAAASRTRVLLSCVGPFTTLGETAAEAALLAGVHYVDCAGEASFIADLIERYDGRARAAGTAMAPALGFDEVPADVAATLATQGLDRPELVLTYHLSSGASWGTIRSALAIVSTTAPWIEDGVTRSIRAGQEERWAPLPPPLGPSRSISFPLAEGHLAPLHLDLGALKLFLVASAPVRVGLRLLAPALKAADSVGATALLDAALSRGKGGPGLSDRARASWAILAEATAGPRRRNVVVSGSDNYGLTAELLATGALAMAREDRQATGVLAPVQAVPLERWQHELAKHEAQIEVFES
jgi:short subunit dehydrogenase-like uncharacterized protein